MGTAKGTCPKSAAVPVKGLRARHQPRGSTGCQHTVPTVTQSGRCLPLHPHLLWLGDGAQNEPEGELVWIRQADRPLTVRGFRRDGHGIASHHARGRSGRGGNAWRDLGEDAMGVGRGLSCRPVVSPLVDPAPIRQGTGGAAAPAPFFPPAILRAM